jgi:hypothetical protein
MLISNVSELTKGTPDEMCRKVFDEDAQKVCNSNGGAQVHMEMRDENDSTFQEGDREDSAGVEGDGTNGKVKQMQK